MLKFRKHQKNLTEMKGLIDVRRNMKTSLKVQKDFDDKNELRKEFKHA